MDFLNKIKRFVYHETLYQIHIDDGFGYGVKFYKRFGFPFKKDFHDFTIKNGSQLVFFYAPPEGVEVQITY